MKQLLCFLSLLLPAVFPAFGGDLVRIPEARSIGLGGNGVVLSILFNPALISLTEKKELSTTYYNRFAMKELGTVSASFLYPNPILDAGISISSYGYDLYRETVTRVAMSKLLGSKFTLGLALSYRFLQTEVLDESPSWLAADLGITYHLSETVLLGASVLNFPSARLGNAIENARLKIGYSFRCGFTWQLLPSFLLTGEIENNYEFAVLGNLGVEYNPFTAFNVRVGINTQPLSPAMGIGYSYSLFTADLAATYHPILGMSTSIGIKISF